MRFVPAYSAFIHCCCSLLALLSHSPRGSHSRLPIISYRVGYDGKIPGAQRDGRFKETGTIESIIVCDLQRG